MSYKHGLYGEIVASNESIIISKTVPIYIGIAPIHRIKPENRVINKPLLIRNLEQAQIKLGYRRTDNFDEFTLSAVVFAHFENSIEPIGPIVVIILDTINNTESASETLEIFNGVGKITSNALIDTLTVADKENGVDYQAKYNESGVLEITGKDLGNEVSITYKKSDTSKIKSENVIGSYDEETESRTGIQAVSDVYEELNIIPEIIAAPGFSQIKEVEKALVKSTSKISDRWEAICYIDINSDEATSRDKAIEWKVKNNYNANCEKICWPKFRSGNKVLWASIVAIVRKLQTDSINSGIPYESSSNKEIDIDGLVVNGNSIRFSQEKANELNEKGITTAIYSGGKYVLWGPHMSNYDYGTTTSVDEIFDVNIMMNKYLLNDFNYRNIDKIDKPMTRNDIDALIVSEQMILNAYVTAGQLLYGEISFNGNNNSRSDMIQGDFTFDTLVTNTPPAKSMTQRVRSTSKGIDNLYENKEE
ncbi:phage tail sheath family protein [Clostridium botulinum 202F]|nr:phage tail sheath family protein [Clostridium botulinum 202F]KAI3346158.1 phage tail sheath subtilisin-like domain-containing protein [Clostridium botulinum]KON12094.1 hypothetical protein ACP50_09110 [Clostridium botulinum]MBY6985162.1 phage tail sheath subtilisin-like domain-containing protein [Clostridium botulinum]NFH01078.1 hypothetical protein [Clostridium botulinum]